MISTMTSSDVAELLASGDRSAAAGEWMNAVRHWERAAMAGAADAVGARLSDLIRRGEAARDQADRAVPRRAGRWLLFGFEGSLVAIVAFVAANAENSVDKPLMWLGWAATAVAIVGFIGFAITSGTVSTERRTDPVTFQELVRLAEISASQLDRSATGQ